jgi:hypothetical protein
LDERELLVQKLLFCFQPELVPLVVFSTRRPEFPLVNPDGVLMDWTWMLVEVTVAKPIPEGPSMAV